MPAERPVVPWGVPTDLGEQKPNLDRCVVVYVATTCDEHDVCVTNDSA